MSLGWDHILHEGEKILWQGRPTRGLSLDDIKPSKFIFSLFFIGFSLFWTIQAFEMAGSFNGFVGVIFPLFGIFFVCTAFKMFYGKLIKQVMMRRNTHYTLTNRRAFIAQNMPFRAKSLRDIAISSKTSMSWVGNSVEFTGSARSSSGAGTVTTAAKFEHLGDQVSALRRALKGLDAPLESSS